MNRTFTTLSRTVCAAACTRAAPRAMARPLVAVSKSVLAQPMQLTRRFATTLSNTDEEKGRDPAEARIFRLLRLGFDAMDASDIPSAKDAYSSVLAIDDKNADALYNLGICHYSERNMAAAITLWEDAIDVAPSSDAHMNLSNAYALSVPARPDKAIYHIKEAARLSPEDPEIQYNMGALLEACEQLSEAAVAYKRALDGGVERASQNLRNCNAKILAAQLTNQANGKGAPAPAPASASSPTKEDETAAITRQAESIADQLHAANAEHEAQSGSKKGN